MIGRVYFQGMYFKLNKSYDLFDFCKLSVLGECIRYYDKYIFRSDKGVIAAYVNDFNNWYYI